LIFYQTIAYRQGESRIFAETRCPVETCARKIRADEDGKTRHFVPSSDILQTIRQTPVEKSDKLRLALSPENLISLMFNPEGSAVDSPKVEATSTRGRVSGTWNWTW
jgi:hypothetical protein